MPSLVVLQALGWLTVLWIVIVHVMVERGRLPHGGPAWKLASSVAAAGVVVAGVASAIWPLVVLGLLWMRSERLAHRQPLVRDPADLDLAEPGSADPDSVVPGVAHGRRRREMPHGLSPHTVDVLFKIEIAVVVAVALILFGFWAEQRKGAFDGRTDRTVCELGGKC